MRSFVRSTEKRRKFKMDALEQNDYDVFRRDVYRVDVSNESQQSRRIVRSIDEDDDDEDFDDLEALRLAALRSLGSKNSYAKRGSTTADVGDTRRVSLGREDQSDLQIVALERHGSFSSSSTDYEEIDLNAPSDVVVNEDKRTFPDSDENDSELDNDNSDGEEKYISDSQKEDETLETTCGYEEEDAREGSVEGYDDNDDDDDVVGNNEILTDDDIENNMADSDDDDVENNDALTDDDDVQHEIENELTYEDDVENASDEDVGEDIETNSPNSSEGVEDKLLDSDNEINILNYISITIANENLLANNSEELVDNEEQRNDSILQLESDSEQINHENPISPQRIIVSRSDSEDDNDNEVKNENEIQKLEDQVAFKSEMQSDVKQEKTDFTVLSVTASLETAKTDLLTKENENSVVNVKKTTDLNVKPSVIVVKRNSQLSTVEKPELATTCASKPNKDVRQEMLQKEKTGHKTTEAGNEKGKAQRHNKNSSIKAVNDDGKITTTSKTETEALNAEIEDEENKDFDQLSIEDEDIDFVEEEDLPAVKSKVGLSKIPTERLRTKRSSSRENNRKRRRSYSPERSRTSSRSYRNQSPLRDRLRDQRLRDRSRERFRRRSHSPPSRDRTYRGNYSRRERSRSRDRMQNRITGVSKNRENRRYRSRSRSVSRPRSGRTEKDFKSNVSKPITKDSVKGSVKERLNIKKEGDAKLSSRSPRKEMKTQDNGDSKKKAVKVKESKSLTVVLVANGVKAESRPTTVKSTEVKNKQSKDLRTRLSEKKIDQDAEISQKTVEKDSTKLVKERELDERIQRIKQQNEAILKRAMEIKAEKLKFS